MRKLLLLLLLVTAPLGADTTLTLLHFSDYHSHALPFYTDEGERGGIARAIGYMKQEKKRGALVFSGGDMVNKGAPAWSDKYGCAEWPWLNGVVDAMAFGNHDADYGRETFEKCRGKLSYPVVSANTSGFRPWTVIRTHGVRIGVFAVAGSDFPELVKVPGFQFSDSLSAARETVRVLRDEQHVDAVVMIGHEHAAADYALARAVPGIDLIFGSHSHLRVDLTRIPETSTAFISPSQYLTYISRVEVTIGDGRVKSVKGGLISVDASLPEDRATLRRVSRMQRELEKDPQYSSLFRQVAELSGPMSTQAVASKALEVMRRAAAADVALSTASSFRSPLPAGPITLEQLRVALPYDNEIVVCTMDAIQLSKLMRETSSRKGDSEAYATPIEVLPDHTYRVAAADYMANVAWRDAFDCDRQKTGLRVRDELQKALAAPSP